MTQMNDGVARRAAQVIDRAGRLLGRVAQNVDRLVVHVVRDARGVAADAEAFYQALAAQARAGTGALRATPRLARILSETAWIAAAYHVNGPSEASHRRCARRAHDLAAELRGPLLKVGQFASARADLLPAAWVEELSRLQDRVPPVSSPSILARIDRELGDRRAALGEIDAEPLAAASLAQVHAATLEDGTPVVVKVQVPGIEDAVEADLAALRLIAAVFHKSFPELGLPVVAAELDRAVRGELDYRSEATHAARMATLLGGDRDVSVPAVYPALSSDRVLTLGRIEGERLNDFLASAAAPARDHVIATLIRTTAEQIFVHGCFQADPHPGNFLVVPTDDPARPRLALLDFGCVATLDPATRRAYARLSLSLFTGDGAAAAAGLNALGFRSRDDDGDAVVHLADAMLGALRRGARADDPGFDPTAAMGEAFAQARRHPVAAPSHFVLIGRVLATIGGLVFAHRPAIEPFALIAPALAAAC